MAGLRKDRLPAEARSAEKPQERLAESQIVPARTTQLGSLIRTNQLGLDNAYTCFLYSPGKPGRSS